MNESDVIEITKQGGAAPVLAATQHYFSEPLPPASELEKYEEDEGNDDNSDNESEPKK